MYKNKEKNLLDFINDNDNSKIQNNSLINKVNKKTTLRLNSVSIFNKKEEELFHYLAKYEKSF